MSGICMQFIRYMQRFTGTLDNKHFSIMTQTGLDRYDPTWTKVHGGEINTAYFSCETYVGVSTHHRSTSDERH